MSQSPLWFFLAWTVFVLDCSRLTYPVDGYLPLQDPPTTDLLKAHKLLGFIKNVLSIAIDTQVTADGLIMCSDTGARPALSDGPVLPSVS